MKPGRSVHILSFCIIILLSNYKLVFTSIAKRDGSTELKLLRNGRLLIQSVN